MTLFYFHHFVYGLDLYFFGNTHVSYPDNKAGTGHCFIKFDPCFFFLLLSLTFCVYEATEIFINV